ncbi:MAG: L-lactate dehydrogenase [Clostridia bacterium]|nr:L-lactate dehydrogenase [Clostridia bacterium]
MKAKITVIGAGHVGSHVARALGQLDEVGEIVLVDCVPGKAEAQAMDVADALVWRTDAPLLRAGSYADCADADVTVVAIGQARKPGQTRLDLLDDSVRMVTELGRALRPFEPEGPVVSITNPCDIVSGVLRQALGLSRFRVFGTGTLLDTARMKRVVARQTGYPASEVDGFVMGEHGDSSMIPFSRLTVGGRPAASVNGFDEQSALERTHAIGMDIIEGKGSTEFGIGQATARLCRSMLTDSGDVLPLSVTLEGEYGLQGFNCGVPCVVGRGGVKGIVTVALDEGEQAALRASAEVLARYTHLAADIAGGL